METVGKDCIEKTFDSQIFGCLRGCLIGIVATVSAESPTNAVVDEFDPVDVNELFLALGVVVADDCIGRDVGMVDSNNCVAFEEAYFLFAVRLAPGTGLTLDMGMKRFANQPTYAFPWHGDTIPVQ